jgi:hypothetical protein
MVVLYSPRWITCSLKIITKSIIYKNFRMTSFWTLFTFYSVLLILTPSTYIHCKGVLFFVMANYQRCVNLIF